ncbi:GIY-YIG nuclease family protein [Hellea balneolensis]|uniref:GIY-YIG nuclease family protein n=1 Tax=Hellea balneolensis TaxID=287478 RepID=UPI00041B52D0|nr:GIY-YIG nuclease family protein [Hellea balneolensis]
MEDNTNPVGFRQFEFELTNALIAQLVRCLDDLESAPLTSKNVGLIPDGQGVYQLFLDGKLQYIGKTDSEAGLSVRLLKHSRKISGRPNLRGRVTFKAVQVLVFSAMELETMLIQHYKNVEGKVKWQHSGFGSNDPGRRRDRTDYKIDHFDVLYPIDIDEKGSFEFQSGASIKDCLDQIKGQLPYIFRFGKSHKLEVIKLTQRVTASSVRDAIEQIVKLLPPGWQATRLPGYLILYEEFTEYVHGEKIAIS